MTPNVAGLAGPGKRSPPSFGVGGDDDQVVPPAGGGDHELEGLTRPLLEALAKLSGFESTYLMVFDWASHEQQACFVHSSGAVQVTEGLTIALPEDALEEVLPGVTRSPARSGKSQPDSLVARSLGLEAYASVPVIVAEHHLFGMLCGASHAQWQVSEVIVSVMEFFAQIIAAHVTRTASAATTERAAHAEEQLRSRARFLALAEHQLKTPLTVLEGASTTLLDHWHDLSDEVRTTFLAMIARSTRDLSQRVDALLVEARSDVQAHALRPVRLDLHPFVQMVVYAFTSVSPTHEVVAEVPRGLWLEADPATLNQVLGHLLENAIKYSPSGGVINVRGSRTQAGVQIDVVDEGIGLPEGVDVFQPFLRGPPGELGATPGIGLGLHIVRTLALAMGGLVSARSNAGGGSIFTVVLPGTVPASDTGRSESDDERPDGDAGRPAAASAAPA